MGCKGTGKSGSMSAGGRRPLNKMSYEGAVSEMKRRNKAGLLTRKMTDSQIRAFVKKLHAGKLKVSDVQKRYASGGQFIDSVDFPF